MSHRRLTFRIGPRGRSIALVGAAAAVLWLKPMGLLLWARIKILTNIPRTAIADEPRATVLPEPVSLLSLDPIALPRASSRNPFAESSMPSADGTDRSDSPHSPTVAPDSDGSGDADGAKSDADQADVALSVSPPEPVDPEAFRHRLQGLVSGGPLAVIDGRTYRVGDTIASLDGSEPFTLVEVKNTAAVLARAGHRYELRMGPSPSATKKSTR